MFKQDATAARDHHGANAWVFLHEDAGEIGERRSGRRLRRGGACCDRQRERCNDDA